MSGETIPDVVTVAIDGSPAHYLSSGQFISAATDTPANTPFLPRIGAAITYERQVGCVIWGNSATKVAVGTIDLIATDGQIDSWIAEQWRDRNVTIRIGDEDQEYADHAHVAFAVVERLGAPNFEAHRISLRDKGSLLEVSAQTEVYPFMVLVPALEGTPKPMLIGENEGIPFTLVDPEADDGNKLDYDIMDSDPYHVDEVLDQGVIMTQGGGGQWQESPEPGVYGVRRLTEPFGKQTCTARGATNGSVFIERLPEVISYLVNRSGGRVTDADVDPYSIDELNSLAPYALGYYGRDATTIASILTQMLDSFCGWWYFDRLGMLRVGRLEDPEETGTVPVISLDNEIDIVSDISARFDEAKGLSDLIGFRRNWSPYADGEIAQSVTSFEPARAARLSGAQLVRKGAYILHDSYAHARGAPPIRTLISSVANAQTEIDRITQLYSVERYFYEFSAALRGGLAYTLEPGDVINVTADRYGLDAGKNLLVVGARAAINSNIVALTLWGAGPQSGDF